MTSDLIIRDGRIVDGTGVPFYSKDIGIRGGSITRIDTEYLDFLDTLPMGIGYVANLGQSGVPYKTDPRGAPGDI
jgi:hypothetical protein